MSDEVNSQAGLDPFEFLNFLEDGEQSPRPASFEQNDVLHTEPDDVSSGGTAVSAEHTGHGSPSNLSKYILREHELASTSASNEPFPAVPGSRCYPMGSGTTLNSTNSFDTYLDDPDNAATLPDQNPYGAEYQTSFDTGSGILTQFGEGALTQTQLADFDPANDDLITIPNGDSPDSAGNSDILMLDPEILHLSKWGDIEGTIATRSDIAADFTDLLAGRTCSNLFGDNVPLAAGDFDITADLAELTGQSISTSAAQASSESKSVNKVMSGTSAEHEDGSMSFTSEEDIGDTISDVSGEDVDEVMSDAPGQPGSEQAIEKGKGKAVENDGRKANDKGKAPARSDVAEFQDEYDGFPILTDAQVEARTLMPVNPIPNTVGPYTSEITSLYEGAHLASSRARESSRYWKTKLEENNKVFRNKRKELADLGIATLRRRNEKRDAGGIMNKKNFEHATPERKAYLLKTYGSDVKIRELTHFCECEADLFNQMADEMDQWKKILEHLEAALSIMRNEVAMGTQRAREDVFCDGDIYLLDNTEAILKACGEGVKAINESVDTKPRKKDGTEFTGNIEDWTQHDVEDDQTVVDEEMDDTEEGQKVYSTSDEEDESD